MCGAAVVYEGGYGAACDIHVRAGCAAAGGRGLLAMMAEAFQILSDCPCCRVESAVVELLDPSVAQGVAVEARCQLCGYLARLGTVVSPGERFQTAAAAEAALRRWAAAEGESDLEMFCVGALGGHSLAEVCDRLVRGEPIGTSFDVLAILFPGMAGTGGGGGGEGAAVFAPTASMDGFAPLEAPPRPVRWASPRLVQRALAAVMLADGEVRPRERAFVDAYLSEAGLAALEEDDLQPWRPGDLGWPADPAPVVGVMVELAYADRQRDASEWRVVREFARHWGYPLAALEKQGQLAEARVATAGQRLWRALRGLLFVQDAADQRRS